MYICLNRGTCGGSLPLDQFVQIAGDAGFEGADVDLHYAVERGVDALQDLYARHNVQIGAWGPPFDFRDDKAAGSGGMDKLDKYAKIARQLNLDSAATYILPASDLPFIENWNYHVQRLQPIAKVLADHGLRFGLEFVAPYHHRLAKKHEFIFTPGQMLELAADVGDNAGLLVDCFHCYTAGTTWEHLAQIPAEKIVQAHLNDAPDVPLGKIDDFTRVLPGEGVIDVKAYMNALKTAGYTGPVCLEVFSKELANMPPADAAKRAWTATAKALGR